MDRRAKGMLARTKPKKRGSGSPKTRQNRRRRAATREDSQAGAWHYVISGVGSKEGLRFLLDAGLFGRSLPRELGMPPGDRVLVLVPHQDDEGIGAGGTLIRCARAGKRLRIVYYTDGATHLGDLDRDEVSRVRYGEARRAWRRVAEELDFVGVPTGSPTSRAGPWTAWWRSSRSSGPPRSSCPPSSRSRSSTASSTAGCSRPTSASRSPSWTSGATRSPRGRPAPRWWTSPTCGGASAA